MATSGTHFSKLTGRIKWVTTNPTDPQAGDEFFNVTTNTWVRYTGSNWIGFRFTSSSTSTSVTTSTSTSVTTS